MGGSDGFNNAKVNPEPRADSARPSTTFLAMLATSVMHVDTGITMENWYQKLLSRKDAVDTGDPEYSGYHYFGNALEFIKKLLMRE